MNFFYKISPLAVMRKPVSCMRNHICASPAEQLKEKLQIIFHGLRDSH